MPELSETLSQALSYYESGNWQQAHLLCCQNLINERERSKTLNLLGLIAHQLGQTELGISYIRQSLSLDPNYAKAYCNLGQILQTQKKLSEAIVNFNLALKLEPDLLFHVQEVQFNLSQINQLLHDFDLKFISFIFKNSLVKETYKKLFPSDLNMTNLLFWDAVEDIYPNTFLEMYNFWCQKNADSGYQSDTYQ